jgi:hypothetical protein
MPWLGAIYCRISHDHIGAGLGVERQEQDYRELAARLGWTVTAVHTDNDLSAYDGKPRPGYRVLLADLEGGRMDAVLAVAHRPAVPLTSGTGGVYRGLRNSRSLHLIRDMLVDGSRTARARELGVNLRSLREKTDRVTLVHQSIAVGRRL